MANLAEAAMCLDMDEEAVGWLEKLEELEKPYSDLPAYWIELAWKQGRLEDARRQAVAWVQAEPDGLFARDVSAAAAMMVRDVDTAEAEFESLYRDVPEWGLAWMSIDIRAGLAWALLEQGENERAHELLQETLEWLEDARGGLVDQIAALYGSSMVYAMSGDREAALARLQEAVDKGAGGSYWDTALDPRFDNISSDSRFNALMDRMKAEADSMRARVERGEVDLGIG